MPNTINLNDTVYVQLTDHGRDIIKRQREALNKKYPHFNLKTEKDEVNGWSSWQLHSLFQTFGDIIHVGGHNPFNLDISLVDPNSKWREKTECYQ